MHMLHKLPHTLLLDTAARRGRVSVRETVLSIRKAMDRTKCGWLLMDKLHPTVTVGWTGTAYTRVAMLH